MRKHNAVDESMDRAKEYVDSLYTKHRQSCQRLQIQIDKFQNLVYVFVQIGSKAPIVRVYLEGAEVFTYWMTHEQRAPLVQKMLLEGYKQVKIAAMLKLSTTTIHRTVRLLREADQQFDTALASLQAMRSRDAIRRRQGSIAVTH